MLDRGLLEDTLARRFWPIKGFTGGAIVKALVVEERSATAAKEIILLESFMVECFYLLGWNVI